jgi:ABC-type Fe3+ transport system substrate-binding protein
MNSRFWRKRLVLLFVMWPLVTNAKALGAAAGDPVIKAKQESEAKGYVFFTSHEEIVSGAQKEGKLRLLGALDPRVYKAMINAFKKRYPFVTDIYVEDIGSIDAKQRFLLELKSKRAAEWDIFDLAPELWSEYMPYIKKIDILGMAMHNVLAVPPAMIDPKNRNIVSTGSSVFVVGYNKKSISQDRAPKTWEEFLKPEFKGKKFMVDVRPLGFAALASGLGEQWALEYAANIASQDPVWVRGQSRALATIVAGERAMLHLAYYHSCQRAAKKDPSGSLECKVIEPVPGRIQEFAAVNSTAPHPYTSILWLEFQASREGQNIVESFEPMNTSVYAPDSALARELKGKKLSIIKWDSLDNSSRWEQMMVKAFGFPKAE